MLVDQAIIANLIGMVDGATPEGDEGRVVIPAVIQPVVQLRRPLVNTVSGATPHRISVTREGSQTMAASTGTQNLGILQLGSGLWEIFGMHSLISDFNQAVADPCHSQVQLRTADDVLHIISSLFAQTDGRQNNFSLFLAIRLKTSDTNQYFEFNMRTNTTGVGETSVGFCTIIAHKHL